MRVPAVVFPVAPVGVQSPPGWTMRAVGVGDEVGPILALGACVGATHPVRTMAARMAVGRTAGSVATDDGGPDVVSSLVPCQCGRGDVVGVLQYRLGGSLLVHPLHGRQADANAADWRCVDCVADACRLLPLTPTHAAAELERERRVGPRA